MKRCVLTTLALACCLLQPAFAQKDRIVASSAEETPAWIGCSDANRIAVTETGETLAEAAARCLDNIRRQIVSSVAVNIASSDRMVSRQITRNELIDVMTVYSSDVQTTAGELPYLTDLSLTNAEAVYWERIYSRKTKSYRYEYSVLYPFTAAQRQRLIDAFLEIDGRKQADLERLRAECDTLTDLDRINEAVNRLDGLQRYFFDATRRNEARALQADYRNLIDDLSIVGEERSAGRYVFSLRLHGRRAVTSKTPRLKAPVEVEVAPYGDDRYLLTYDARYASPYDVNQIEIAYLFGAKRVEHLFRFDPMEGRVRVQPVGTVRIATDATATTGTLELSVTGERAEIESIVFYNPADDAPLRAERIAPQRVDAGRRSVSFILPSFDGGESRNIEIVSGTLTVRNIGNDTTGEVGFILPYTFTKQPDL